jgi:Flp pilus assembly protein TadG
MIKGRSIVRYLIRGSSSFERLCARLGKDAGGVAAVEFGLMVPLFGLMLVSVTDIGLSVYRKMQVEGAAQAGARYAMLRGFDASAISETVTNASNAAGITAAPAPTKFCGCPSGISIDTVECGTTCPGGALAGTYTTVSAQASYTTILDYQVAPANYTFSAQSTVRLK